MRTALAIALALTSLPPVGAEAQTAGALPVVLELPASTRAMALGNAYQMNAGHADAIFYHPSLLTGATGFGADLQRWGTRSSSAAVSAAMSWLGGGVGLGILNLQYGAPDVGRGAAPAGQDHLFEFGPVPVSERVAVLGYARELFGIDVGVAGKLAEERIGGWRDAELLVDLGASTDLGPLTVALTVRDWGREPIVDTGGASPTRVVLGAGAYGRQVGIFDLGLTAALDYADDDLSAGGGVEIGYWPINGRTFVARIGVREATGDASPITLGFAFWGDDLVLEWAFQPVDGASEGGTHRFGVRFR